MQDTATLLIAFLGGLIIGGGLVWLIARARIAEAKTDLEIKNAVLQETLDQERRQAREKPAIEIEAAAMLRKQNKDEIDAVLKPLQEKLREFQQELQQANKETATQRAVLGEQIRNLSQASASMTAETTNLTRALKGDAQVQGAWGERILESILEKSGLREGEEYTFQQSHAGEDDQRLRTDALVNLPGGQKIVVDGKVSLKAFDAYIKAENDSERTQQLAQHLASMRAHIKGLGGKNYPQAVGGDLDYAVMFVPIEGALAAALQREGDPELTAYAIENNVTIATPTTLMIVLRTVANIWQVERRNRNAEAIAARAGKIYDKLVGFMGDLTQVGARLDQAQSAYGEAVNKLSIGRGNVLSQVEELKELGAKTAKSLPSHLVDETEAKALPDKSSSKDAA
jgi:DNA recombination protein RmuC